MVNTEGARSHRWLWAGPQLKPAAACVSCADTLLDPKMWGLSQGACWTPLWLTGDLLLSLSGSLGEGGGQGRKRKFQWSADSVAAPVHPPPTRIRKRGSLWGVRSSGPTRWSSPPSRRWGFSEQLLAPPPDTAKKQDSGSKSPGPGEIRSGNCCERQACALGRPRVRLPNRPQGVWLVGKGLQTHGPAWLGNGGAEVPLS